MLAQDIFLDSVVDQRLDKLLITAARLRELRERVAISPEEAAELLAVTPETLKNWRKQKRGPAYYKTESKTIRYKVDDLEQWLQARKHTH